MREGNWKLVAERGRDWELYNLAEDRTERNNLLDQHLERVASMKKQYDAWAARIGALSDEEAKNMPVNQQDRYLYEDEKQEMAQN